MLFKNQGSIFVSSYISLTFMPTLIACGIYHSLSELGVFSFAFISLISASVGSKPAEPISRLLSAFCKDSLNVLPMDITSPTDFI